MSNPIPPNVVLGSITFPLQRMDATVATPTPAPASAPLQRSFGVPYPPFFYKPPSWCAKVVPGASNAEIQAANARASEYLQRVLSGTSNYLPFDYLPHPIPGRSGDDVFPDNLPTGAYFFLHHWEQYGLSNESVGVDTYYNDWLCCVGWV